MASDLVAQVQKILAETQAQFKEEVEEASWQTAVDISRQVAGEAPKDTTSLANSVYASASDGRSTYAEAVDQAVAVNHRVIILSEAQPIQSAEIREAVVGVAAKHGFFVENGYSPEGGRMPNPFFARGTVNAKEVYQKNLRDVLRS